MDTCVCMYACMNACMDVCMHASMHACVQRLCVSTYACMYAHIYTYTCMHVYYVYVAFALLVLVLADVPPPALRGKDAHVFFSPPPRSCLLCARRRSRPRCRCGSRRRKTKSVPKEACRSFGACLSGQLCCAGSRSPGKTVNYMLESRNTT
jgi:hypothetical protein